MSSLKNQLREIFSQRLELAGSFHDLQPKRNTSSLSRKSCKDTFADSMLLLQLNMS